MADQQQKSIVPVDIAKYVPGTLRVAEVDTKSWSGHGGGQYPFILFTTADGVNAPGVKPAFFGKALGFCFEIKRNKFGSPYLSLKITPQSAGELFQPTLDGFTALRQDIMKIVFEHRNHLFGVAKGMTYHKWEDLERDIPKICEKGIKMVKGSKVDMDLDEKGQIQYYDPAVMFSVPVTKKSGDSMSSIDPEMFKILGVPADPLQLESAIEASRVSVAFDIFLKTWKGSIKIDVTARVVRMYSKPKRPTQQVDVSMMADEDPPAEGVGSPKSGKRTSEASSDPAPVPKLDIPSDGF